MNTFIAIVLGLVLAEYWHGERENAESKKTKIICLFAEYGSYILTLIYLYTVLTQG